ncbi:hypothetical protein TNCV_2781201 [Trichonephila clavipes]|nr:hypothetical protein TNCV_2781201 [Trichonephila clavipes]
MTNVTEGNTGNVPKPKNRFNITEFSFEGKPATTMLPHVLKPFSFNVRSPFHTARCGSLAAVWPKETNRWDLIAIQMKRMNNRRVSNHESIIVIGYVYRVTFGCHSLSIENVIGWPMAIQ